MTGNFSFKFLEPLKKPFTIQMILYYRYGTIFRQIIDTNQNECSSYMEGAGGNPLIKTIAEYVNNYS